MKSKNKIYASAGVVTVAFTIVHFLMLVKDVVKSSAEQEENPFKNARVTFIKGDSAVVVKSVSGGKDSLGETKTIKSGK